MLIAAAILLCVALFVREIQLMRERNLLCRTVDDLRLSQQSVKDGTRRLAEDVFVLQNLLLERNLLQEPELMRARGRLIEQPRRRAEERSAMLRHVGRDKAHALLEDADGVVH